MTKGYVYNLKKEKDNVNVARYIPEKSRHFEVAIDPDLAADFLAGKISDVREVLLSEEIFTDTKKGLRPSEHELIEVFGTSDSIKAAETIIRKGIIQLTDKFRDEQRESKKKRIIELIHINCVDAKTGFPLPVQRIENAMAEAKVKIKEGKSPEEQIQEIVKELKPIIPIKMDVREYRILVPMKYASACHPAMKSYGSIIKEEWKPDGSLSCTIEIPAGLSEEFFSKVNSLTHGDALIEQKQK